MSGHLRSETRSNSWLIAPAPSVVCVFVCFADSILTCNDLVTIQSTTASGDMVPGSSPAGQPGEGGFDFQKFMEMGSFPAGSFAFGVRLGKVGNRILQTRLKQNGSTDDLPAVILQARQTCQAIIRSFILHCLIPISSHHL